MPYARLDNDASMAGGDRPIHPVLTVTPEVSMLRLLAAITDAGGCRCVASFGSSQPRWSCCWWPSSGRRSPGRRAGRRSGRSCTTTGGGGPWPLPWRPPCSCSGCLASSCSARGARPGGRTSSPPQTLSSTSSTRCPPGPRRPSPSSGARSTRPYGTTWGSPARPPGPRTTNGCPWASSSWTGGPAPRARLPTSTSTRQRSPWPSSSPTTRSRRVSQRRSPACRRWT